MHRGRLLGNGHGRPGQPFLAHQRAGLHHIGALHGVAQLAHIAGPAVLRKLLEGRCRELLGLALALGDGLHEMLRKQRNVGQALAQRRQLDGEDVQAVQQVFAQLAAGHGLVGAAVGGGDHAHIGLQRLGGAHAHEAAGLQHAKQLDLQLHRHFRDFVQKQRARGRALEKALVLAVGAGEAALFVAKDLAFDQVRRNGPAVDRQEGPAAPLAQLMQGLCHDFLAGAAFARQKDRDRGTRHALHLLVQPLHGGRAAPQPAKAPFLRAVAGAWPVLRGDLVEGRAREGAGARLRQAGRGDQKARKNILQPPDAHGLDQIVHGAAAQGLDGGVQAGVAGHQHDLRVLRHLLVAKKVHAVAIGQLQVQQHQAGRLHGHLPARVAQSVGHGDREAVHAHEFAHGRCGIRIVIDDQHVVHCMASRGPRRNAF